MVCVVSLFLIIKALESQISTVKTELKYHSYAQTKAFPSVVG